MDLGRENAETGSVEIINGGGINRRAILLGAALAVLFSAINGYLSINIGWNFGYGAVAVILAYSLFHKLGGGSCRKELSFVLISSASTLGLYYGLATVIYMLQTDSSLSFPHWMSPPREAIVQGSLDMKYWITPIAFLMLTTVLTLVAGLVFTYVLRREFIRSEKMVWPQAAANASLVDACITGGGSARLVGLAALIGFAITFLQNLPLFWGYDLTSLDLSPYLPRGVLFAISLSLGFGAIGYMISYKTSLSLMVTGFVTNLVIAPYLVSKGIVEYTPNIMQTYQDLLFKFSVSPALGVLLLGGVLLSVFFLVKNSLSKTPNNRKGEADLGYAHLYKVLFRGLLSDKRCFLILAAIAATMFSLVWVFNPFSPLPRAVSMLITAYMFLLGSFIELVLITKMSGEIGMSMGIMSIFLYDVPIFSTGYRGYAGFWSYPYFRPSPWISNGVLPYLKYRDKFDLSWREIVKAKIVGWVPTILFSVAFTLILWRYIGFGTAMMPSVQLIQSKVYLTMLATGDISGTINPLTFLAGGVMGAFLEVFTPVSMMGLGMGMLLPPHYIVPFGLGGIIRWYTDRRFGKEFYDEKGRLIVTGLMASSLIVQVIMTILTNFF
ncbi:MAG: OPT/YSL family transporter [Candidatus Bathyarchaeota archaeon]|nr:MAG: OPT/YSL family transporter [Candidatus Bathyarchaeota archaeon]